ncbi:MAG: hypothetical protein OES47_13335, partial [Acidobacteriota bacterium]|nr:hypothetical protein [Acidobacteriota bacterium]
MTSRTKRDKPPRRRPGRFRRWVLRPAVWALVVLGVVFWMVFLYLGSAGFAERVRRDAERRLEAVLERDVRIDSLNLELMPLIVEVEGFEIAGSEPGRESAVSLDHARLEARVGSLLRPGIYLDELVLERPRFRMTYDEHGRHDLPLPGRRGGNRSGGPPVDIEIGQVQVVGGEIAIEHRRIPLELEAKNFEAHFSGTGEEFELRGSAAADEVMLVLRGSNPYVGRVAVDGLLRSHRFDIERLNVRAPDLDARAEGFVRWRGDREATLQIDATGDLRLFERLGYLKGQTAGDFEFSGALTRKPGVLLLAGDAVSPKAMLFGRLLTDLRARVEGDRNTIRIEAERARYGDGSVRGTIRLGLAVDSGRVDLELDLDRVPLDRLLADQQIPIEGLGGAVSGAFNYQFEASAARAGNGWADLVISDEIDPDPGDLPFAGTAPLAIGDGVIRSAALRVASEAQQLIATGLYDLRSSSGSYDFELTSERIEEVAALLPVTDEAGPGSAWRPVEGRGRVAGTLTLDRSKTSVAARIDLEELSAPGYRADRMLGTVTVDGSGVRDLRLELARPDAALIVSGSLPFDETGPSGSLQSPPLALALDAAGWPLDEAEIWLPFELPVSGLYSGSLEFGGEMVSPHGRLQGRLTSVRFRDLECEALELDMSFDAELVTVKSSTLEVSGGTVDLFGELDRIDGDLSFVVGSSPLDLRDGQIAETLGVDLAGRLEIDGRIGGTFARPDVEAKLAWGDVMIGGIPVPPEERPEMELTWSDSELVARGSVLGLVDLAGGGEASAAGVSLSFELDRGRLDRMTQLASHELLREVGGSFSGRLSVAGSPSNEASLLSPADFTAQLTLDRLLAERGELKLTNLEPVEAELDARELRIRSFFLGDVKTASDLFIGGVVGLGEPGALDLDLQASLATDWLEPILRSQWPSARLGEGVFEAIGSVSGEPSSPKFNGVGEISGGRITAEELPTSLDQIGATLLFYPELVVLEDSQATVAGGKLRAGGSIDLKNPSSGVPYR